MNNSRLLIIFIKNLEKGRVKTRLAETLGDEKALEVYKKLTELTRSVALASDADKQVWYSRFIPDKDEWNEADFEKKLQQGENLGARMKDAFSRAFQNGYKKVAIIGSDCAELTPRLLNEAYFELESNDVVIGPSKDGGYYLLGMNAFYGSLFEDIPWSTPQVLPTTIEVTQKMGLNVHLLPERNDVDNEVDWLTVKDQL